MTQENNGQCPSGCRERFASLEVKVENLGEEVKANTSKIGSLDRIIRGNGTKGLLSTQETTNLRLKIIEDLLVAQKKTMQAVIIPIVLLILEGLWQVLIHYQSAKVP